MNISQPGQPGRTITNARPSKNVAPAVKIPARPPSGNNPGGVQKTVKPLFQKAGVPTAPSWNRE